MPSNVGGMDRTVRVLRGLVLLPVAYFALSGTLASIAYVVAGIALVTALVRFCPANALLGINTCETEEAGADRLRHEHRPAGDGSSAESAGHTSSADEPAEGKRLAVLSLAARYVHIASDRVVEIGTQVEGGAITGHESAHSHGPSLRSSGRRRPGPRAPGLPG